MTSEQQLPDFNGRYIGVARVSLYTGLTLLALMTILLVMIKIYIRKLNSQIFFSLKDSVQSSWSQALYL